MPTRALLVGTAWFVGMCMTIFLLVAPVSGCGKAAPTPEPATAPADEPVTVRFAGYYLERDYYEELIRAFNDQYPTIPVEFLPHTEDELAALGPGAADVRPVWQGMFGSVQKRGDLLTLDPVIHTDESLLELSDLYPGVAQVFATDGRIWAIPVGANPRMMYYNVDLFDRYGVPYPETDWTWDDFLGAARAIRDPDAGVYGYACLGYLYEPTQWVFSHGGQIFDDMQDPTRTTFDDPLTVEALEWYGDLAREHDVCITSGEAGGVDDVFRIIRAGRVGMWTTGFVARGGWDWPDGSNAELRFPWGMVPLPRDRRSSSGTFVAGHAISSQAEHPDAAWKWIAFLSRQVHEYLAPVRRSVAESAEFEELVGGEIAAAARAALEDGLLLWPPSAFTKFGEELDILRAAVNDILGSRKSAQEAMDWAQQEAARRAAP
jgi:multiple sugar transport system substrate-binding protein